MFEDFSGEYHMVPIKDLILLENNPRKISKEAMEKLCKSIRDDPVFFRLRPCLVNSIGDLMVVYAGNQRVRAAKKLKMKEVPCIIQDNVSDELIKSRILKDNKTYGTFDYDLLANEYDIDSLINAGFTAEELDINVDDICPKKEDEENNKKAQECPNCGHQF